MPDIHFKCYECDKSLSIDDQAVGMQVPCPDCNKILIVPAAPSAQSRSDIRAGNKSVIKCRQCDGIMVQTKRVEKSIGLQIVGVLVALMALGMMVLFPIGTIVGLILLILAARLGYSKKKVWACESCGYFFERA